jgi:hypothetical protein
MCLLSRRSNLPGVQKPVVFLQHGVTLASDCFTVFGANESLAYILADAGTTVALYFHSTTLCAEAWYDQQQQQQHHIL